MCSSCAAKNQLMTNQQEVISPAVPQTCLYSFEELQAKLQAAYAAENYLQVSIIRSAINLYNKDCNQFNNYIL
jgi:hypothetical protein